MLATLRFCLREVSVVERGSVRSHLTMWALVSGMLLGILVGFFWTEPQWKARFLLSTAPPEVIGLPVVDRSAYAPDTCTSSEMCVWVDWNVSSTAAKVEESPPDAGLETALVALGRPEAGAGVGLTMRDVGWAVVRVTALAMAAVSARVLAGLLVRLVASRKLLGSLWTALEVWHGVELQAGLATPADYSQMDALLTSQLEILEALQVDIQNLVSARRLARLSSAQHHLLVTSVDTSSPSGSRVWWRALHVLVRELRLTVHELRLHVERRVAQEASAATPIVVSAPAPTTPPPPQHTHPHPHPLPSSIRRERAPRRSFGSLRRRQNRQVAKAPRRMFAKEMQAKGAPTEEGDASRTTQTLAQHCPYRTQRLLGAQRKAITRTLHDNHQVHEEDTEEEAGKRRRVDEGVPTTNHILGNEGSSGVSRKELLKRSLAPGNETRGMEVVDDDISNTMMEMKENVPPSSGDGNNVKYATADEELLATRVVRNLKTPSIFLEGAVMANALHAPGKSSFKQMASQVEAK